MNMQALLIRATFMALLAIGLTLAMVHVRVNKDTANSLQPTLHPVAQANLVAKKRSGAVLIMLPAINVRANVHSHASNKSSDGDMASSSIRIVESQPRKLSDAVALTPSLHRLRLDMPYYSFGRAMPQASKE